MDLHRGFDYEYEPIVTLRLLPEGTSHEYREERIRAYRDDGYARGSLRAAMGATSFCVDLLHGWWPSESVITVGYLCPDTVGYISSRLPLDPRRDVVRLLENRITYSQAFDGASIGLEIMRFQRQCRAVSGLFPRQPRPGTHRS